MSGKIVYEDAQAKTVSIITIEAPNSTAFNTGITTILGTAALGTTIDGTPSHDNSEDTYSATHMS